MAKAVVCKTIIQRFESARRLQNTQKVTGTTPVTFFFLDCKSHFQSIHRRCAPGTRLPCPHTSMPQISLAYCRMVRSVENLPILATLSMAIWVHCAGSRKVSLTLSWLSRYDSRSLSSRY